MQLNYALQKEKKKTTKNNNNSQGKREEFLNKDIPVIMDIPFIRGIPLIRDIPFHSDKFFPLNNEGSVGGFYKKLPNTRFSSKCFP